MMQGPHLLIETLPAGLALRCTLLCRCGRLWGGHGHRDSTREQRHGLPAPPGIDGSEGLLMHAEHAVQGFPEILEEMKPGSDLGGGGCPLARTLGRGW